LPFFDAQSIALLQTLFKTNLFNSAQIPRIIRVICLIREIRD